MNRVAAFEKVEKTRFVQDCLDAGICAERNRIEEAYEALKMPIRATAGSAGYDVFLPLPLALAPGSSMTVPTGLRVRIDEGWMLLICPKSGLGFTYRLQLDNTVGIVDSDYYGAENQGHILVRITNDSRQERTLSLDAGKAFVQGIFVPFGITHSDSAESSRTGGFGSTKA